MAKLKNQNEFSIRILLLIIGLVVGYGINALLPSLAARKVKTNSNLVLTVPSGAFGQTVTATLKNADGTPVPNGVGAGLSTEEPQSYWIYAQCFQNGNQVYIQTVEVVDGSANLTYGPTRSWTGGAASCKATGGQYFVNNKGMPELRQDAVVSFNVSP
jgi:hypothetical protein